MSRNISSWSTTLVVGAASAVAAFIVTKSIASFKKKNDKLARFKLVRLLKVNDGCYSLLGTVDETEAVLIINQTAFTADAASSFVSTLSMSSIHHANDMYTNGLARIASGATAGQVAITLIHPASAWHIQKHTEQEFHLLSESPEDYETITRPYIDALGTKRHQWVYNVLDKQEEADSVLLEEREDGFMLLPDTKWSSSRPVGSLYCLALSFDRSITSLRDLTAAHIPLLQSIREKSVAYIESTYGLPASKLRLFVHYQPSYYHFHVHVCHVSIPYGIASGKAVLLDDILTNLALDGAYYQKATLQFLVGESQHSALFKALMSKQSRVLLC